MKFRTTVLLVVCLAVLGGVYALTRNLGGLGAGVGGGESEPLVAGRVESVVVERGERSYELRRTAQGWVQVEPAWYPLSKEAGQRITSVIAELRAIEVVVPEAEGGPSLGELALDPPGAEVTVIGGDGVHEFALGDRMVVGDRAYLRDDDGRVLVVSAGLHDLVYGGWPSAWRERTLPLPPPGALRKITRVMDGARATLERREGQWKVKELAGRPRADPVFLEALNTLAERAQVVSFVSEDSAAQGRFGLENPSFQLTLESADGEEVSLAVGRSADIEGRTAFAQITAEGGAGPQRGAGRRTTPVLTLLRAVIDPLRVPLEALRDRRLFDAPKDLVRSLRIQRAGLPAVALADRGVGLAVVDGSALLPGGVTPGAVLDAVLGLTVEDSLPGYAPEVPPTATVTLRWGARSEAEVSLFREGEGWIAVRSGDPAGAEESAHVDTSAGAEDSAGVGGAAGVEDSVRAADFVGADDRAGAEVTVGYRLNRASVEAIPVPLASP